ncbi:hypothetical protein M153_35600001405, partial [Pseudoloma neurophilia]
MTDSDYLATKATDHRGKNLSKTNNKLIASFCSPCSWNANSLRARQNTSRFKKVPFMQSSFPNKYNHSKQFNTSKNSNISRKANTIKNLYLL